VSFLDNDELPITREFEKMVDKIVKESEIQPEPDSRFEE
jgi:hypothetical protein